MDVGLSSAVFYPYIQTEDSIELISEMGFKCAEIFLNSGTEYENDFIKKLIEEKEKYKLTINSVHSFSSSFEPYLFDLYKRRRKDMLAYFEKVCKAGSMLGAKCYTFHGARLEGGKFIDKTLNIDVYNNLCYIAAENNIKLAQENVSWCMSSKPEYLAELAEVCKYPLYFTLDIKQAYKAGQTPKKYLEVMKHNLVNVHINDRDEKSVCLLPGKGNVDFREFLNDINIYGYKGNLIMELYSDNYKSYKEILNAKNYLESFML
jgi:sugar phosphate isomerase/epimerase